MLSLALGAAITVNYASASFAQAPRNISYQGQLLENNQPATGQYTITINYYTAGASAPIHTETFTNATVQNGIFNVILGSSSAFPASMDFNEQYFIGVQVNGAVELQPRTAMLSAPYALNANTINGYSVSEFPGAGQILVLDNNGRVPTSALPSGPNFVAGNNIVIQEDTLNNTYTFSSTGGSGTGITRIIAADGLFGGGSTGDVTIGIAPNSITSEMIGAGSITGNKLSPILAGEGLYQDILGNLNVGVDNSSIVISNDRLSIGTLGSSNLDSTVQRRITGTANPGSFVTGVNNDGTVTSGTLTTDNSLTRTITGSNVQLGLNPANSNSFTATQNFDVINANTINTRDLNTTGNVVLGNGTNSNLTVMPGAGTINFSNARLQGVGAPLAGTDAVNRDYVTTQVTNQTFGGDVTGTAGNLQINGTNAGIGNRLIQGINTGTAGITNAVINDDLTINGGTINNTIIGGTTPSSATFTDVTVNGTLNANGSANFGNGTTANTFVFNTNGGSISLSGARLQNVGNPTLGTDAVNLQTMNSSIDSNNAAQTLGGDINGANGNNTINTSNPGIGDRLVTGVNSGTTTVNDAAINDSLTINGGTINNTPIGMTGASSGMFTTLSSTQQTMLATTSGDVVIGTATPLNNGAILEIERAQAARLLARLYNTGTGGAEFRIIGANGATSTLSFTDSDEFVSAINSNDGTGLTINVRNTGDANSQAGLDGAVAIRVERDRDVVIEEDLTVLGAVNFGNGNDNLTFNSGTGTVDFSGSRLTNVANPVAGTDAVNLQTLNSTVAGNALAGDISGPNGSNTLNTSNPGIGNRLVSGVNSGTTTINDPAIADNLTINGGTINNTPIGATTPSTGVFTNLTTVNQFMSNGTTMLGDGTGADNVTINPGTGAVNFSAARLQNIANPVSNTDAVNLQTLNSAIATNNTSQTLGGDISGPNGSNTLNTANPGVGDRLVTGVNSGTTTINDPAVADNLTIDGGTINNTPIGMTGASTGNFTTLNSSGQTMLATTTGDVVIGTATPLNTGAILEIERAEAGRLLTRLYNTGTGGAEARIIGANGATSSLSFTDTDEFVSAINSSETLGLTINVRDAGDANSQAGLDGAVAVTIERDRDVIINEDLTVLGAVNFGNGDDNLTFNSGTGTVDFSGSRITNVADPINNMDAVNLQSLNNAVAAATPAALAGDITGPNGSNTIDPTNAGIGDRLVTGVNSGTTTINDPAINDDLTVNGGTVDNTPIGATTASTGNFTTLNSSGQTMLATSTGDVVIGTATPLNTGAILEIERAEAGRLLTRLYNTGAGGAEHRIIGANGATSSVSFTDADEFVSAINSSDAIGLTLNVRDIGDANSQAGLDGAVAVSIERDRDVVINEDLTVGGEMIANSAADGFGVSTRYADTYTVTGAGTTITVPNTLVTPNSTVIITFEDNSGGTPPTFSVQTDSNGSFDVILDTAAAIGDEIHYIIINH